MAKTLDITRDCCPMTFVKVKLALVARSEDRWSKLPTATARRERAAAPVALRMV
jgi:hypothetical protein